MREKGKRSLEAFERDKTALKNKNKKLNEDSHKDREALKNKNKTTQEDASKQFEEIHAINENIFQEERGKALMIQQVLLNYINVSKYASIYDLVECLFVGLMQSAKHEGQTRSKILCVWPQGNN